MGFDPNFFSAYPNSAFGYYRGEVQYGGSGGQVYGQGKGYGPTMAGNTAFAQGQGPGPGTSDWHPSIMYLFVFIFAEMIVFGIISKHL